jgi:hypothetical protein
MPPHNRLTIPVSSSHPAKPGIRKKRVRQSWRTFLCSGCRWRGARWARRKLATGPPEARIAFVVATILTVVSLANVVYQVVRKPTELLFFVGGALDKVPSETWRQAPKCFAAVPHEKAIADSDGRGKKLLDVADIAFEPASR